MNPINPPEDFFIGLVGISTLLAITNLILLIICLIQKRMSGTQFALTLALGILGGPLIGLILSLQYEGLRGLAMMFMGSFYGFGILMGCIFILALVLLIKKKPSAQVQSTSPKSESLDDLEID